VKTAVEHYLQERLGSRRISTRSVPQRWCIGRAGLVKTGGPRRRAAASPTRAAASLRRVQGSEVASASSCGCRSGGRGRPWTGTGRGCYLCATRSAREGGPRRRIARALRGRARSRCWIGLLRLARLTMRAGQTKEAGPAEASGGPRQGRQGERWRRSACTSSRRPRPLQQGDGRLAQGHEYDVKSHSSSLEDVRPRRSRRGSVAALFPRLRRPSVGQRGRAAPQEGRHAGADGPAARRACRAAASSPAAGSGRRGPARTGPTAAARDPPEPVAPPEPAAAQGRQPGRAGARPGPESSGGPSRPSPSPSPSPSPPPHPFPLPAARPAPSP